MLPQLLAQVEAGERVVIARSGKPIADLVPHATRPLRIGTAKGLIRVDDDAFDWGGILSAIIGVVIVLVITGWAMRRVGPGPTHRPAAR